MFSLAVHTKIIDSDQQQRSRVVRVPDLKSGGGGGSGLVPSPASWSCFMVESSSSPRRHL